MSQFRNERISRFRGFSDSQEKKHTTENIWCCIPDSIQGIISYVIELSRLLQLISHTGNQLVNLGSTDVMMVFVDWHSSERPKQDC